MAVTASQLLADPERHLPSIKLLLELARDRDAQVRRQGVLSDLGTQTPCKILLRLDAVRNTQGWVRILTVSCACSCPWGAACAESSCCCSLCGQVG